MILKNKNLQHKTRYTTLNEIYKNENFVRENKKPCWATEQIKLWRKVTKSQHSGKKGSFMSSQKGHKNHD